MDLQSVLACLSSPEQAVPARDAERLMPKNAGPGLYSIFVDRPDSLPEPFAGHLRSRESRLIYFGCSSKPLYQRLVLQDLRHKNRATFFRSIGAVLGYRPLKGSLKGMANQNNYVFSPGDTQKIIDWIDAHLSVCWMEIEAGGIDALEKDAIRELVPLLNDQHNPDCLVELKELREECRRIGRS